MNQPSPSDPSPLPKGPLILLGILITACALLIYWVGRDKDPSSAAPPTPTQSRSTPPAPVPQPQSAGASTPIRAPSLPPADAKSRPEITSFQGYNITAARAAKQQSIATGQAGSKVSPHLSSVVQRVLAAKERGAAALDALSIPKVAKVNEKGQIQIYVRTTDDPDARVAPLKEAGLHVELAASEMKLVQGWMPADTIETLAALDFVARVELPDYARRRTGSVNSEGDAALKANLVRALGSPGPYTGAGIKVGIISDACTNRATAVASGDLPVAGITMHPTLLDPGDEGTAMAEIIHDLAPGAQLFAVGPATSAEMVTAIQWLVSQGCHVLVDDLLWAAQPYFEDGSIAVAAKNAVTNDGRVFVTAAGNDADEHYQGLYAAVAGDTWHDFKSGTGEDATLDVVVPAGESVVVYLQWNDAFGASANDYDMYLGDPSSGTFVDGSTNVQDGNDDPLEIVFYTNTGATDKTLQVLIDNFGGLSAPRTLELLVLDAGLTIDDDRTWQDSIVGHPAVTELISVGAIDQADPGLDAIEVYSSTGPSTISFPSAQSRQTPTITGVDWVSVSGAGGFGTDFPGTSAAAPHIAAICALMLSKNPTATPTQIRTALTNGAIDKGTSGFDNIFGSGLADALAAVNGLSAPATAPEIVVEQPSGTGLADGGALAFGKALVGYGNTRTFTIRNTGTANLTGLAISKDGTNAPQFNVGPPGATTLAPGASTTFDVTFNPGLDGAHTAAIHIASNDADENPFDITLNATGVFPSTIGPDAFGYTATNDVAYSFTDISSTGTVVLDSSGDAFATVPMGFSFNFYGTAASTAHFSTKALITFTTGTTAFSNTDLTTTSFGQPVICALWDDWATNVTTTDKCFYQTTGAPGNRVFTVQWHLNPFAGSGEVVLQCLLFEATGVIRVNYGDTTSSAGRSDGQGATVGIQDTAGNTNGRVLQWSYNTPSVFEGMSLVFSPPALAPEIAVERGPPLPGFISDGYLYADGYQMVVGSPLDFHLTIHNTGTANLTGLTVTKDGANSGDYTVAALATTTLAPGASTALTVTFNPTAAGTRTAAIHIASNDGDENPFDITFSGLGLTQQENWRQTWFGTTSNVGDAADDADPDGDGLANRLEFATGGNPTSPNGPVGQAALAGGNIEFFYTRGNAAVAGGEVFTVQWTDTLNGTDWSSSGVTQTVLSDNGTLTQMKATLPAGASGFRFVRLSVGGVQSASPGESQEL